MSVYMTDLYDYYYGRRYHECIIKWFIQTNSMLVSRAARSTYFWTEICSFLLCFNC